MNGRRIPVEEVARIVTEWPSRTGYTPHIAETFGVPIATARRWIVETRRRGLLPAGSDPQPCRLCGGTGVQMRGKPYRKPRG